jgi:putative ABC transport system substrate-binding protein
MPFDRLKRREFITLLAGGSVAWPLAAQAQQAAMPIVGYLTTRSPQTDATTVAAFRRGLNVAGYVEGGKSSPEFYQPFDLPDGGNSQRQ